MTVTEAGGGSAKPDVWDWLRSCRQCGEIHEWRWTCPYPPPHPQHSGNTCQGGTWATDDGHIYMRRLMRSDPSIDALQREYEEATRWNIDS